MISSKEKVKKAKGGKGGANRNLKLSIGKLNSCFFFISVLELFEGLSFRNLILLFIIMLICYLWSYNSQKKDF